ncbi:MAG: superoxide dismutase family protein [Pseudomonadota bacterium]
MTRSVKIWMAGCATLATAACGGDNGNHRGGTLLESLAPAEWADAAAKFVDTHGHETGHVVLTNAPGAGVLLRLDVQELSEGWHGVHLHQIGDCSDAADGFKASGGHINPDGNAHGLLNPDGRKRANLPNIYAGADGRATAEFFNDTVALFPSEAAAAEVGPHPLLDDDGFAVIIHQNADDHKSQPIGGTGPRVACAAVIRAP